MRTNVEKLSRRRRAFGIHTRSLAAFHASVSLAIVLLYMI